MHVISRVITDSHAASRPAAEISRTFSLQSSGSSWGELLLSFSKHQSYNPLVFFYLLSRFCAVTACPGGGGETRPEVYLSPFTMAPKDTFFRSSDMSLTQLYIANEIGREVVSALGELGQVQFRDVSGSLNPPRTLPHVA